MEIENTIGNRSAKAVSIKRLNKHAYKVRSQTNPDQWYNVINPYEDGWICECLDFQARRDAKIVNTYTAFNSVNYYAKRSTKVQFYNHYKNYKPKKLIPVP